MRYVVIALLSTLAGCELADVEQSRAPACGDVVCEQPDPGASPMSPTASQAGARPPIDVRAPAQVETATFGMG